MKPLIEDFQKSSPDVAIDYIEYLTNELNALASEACRKEEPLGDLLLSSSVDQLLKLANDGCAEAHTSLETARVADWANWRDEVFGFTYEPAVFVYNTRLVPPAEVPRTHVELADLLRERLEYYRGRVGTYDIRLSGIGYLLAFNDARQTTTVFGRLLESMARASAVARCCTGEILEEVAKGNLYIGYNMLGSYAYEAALRHPDLRRGRATRLYAGAQPRRSHSEGCQGGRSWRSVPRLSPVRTGPIHRPHQCLLFHRDRRFAAGCRWSAELERVSASPSRSASDRPCLPCRTGHNANASSRTGHNP